MPLNLNIQDHDNRWWGVDVEPGQMIMFESGCCMHGRLDEYQGTYFDNLYTHFTYEEPLLLMSNKYISFDWWWGGFNNIRMCYEMVGAMSYVSGRTIILPPPGYCLFLADIAIKILFGIYGRY